MHMASAATGVTLPEVPVPPVGKLADFVEEFLSAQFEIEFFLSLEDAPDGVPEWTYEPVRRGFYLNASAEASFIGFELSFRVVAQVLIPTPELHDVAKTAAFVVSFFSNPVGILTGEVAPPPSLIKFGFEVEAEGSLPLDLGYVRFYGFISFNRYVQEGEGYLNLIPGMPMWAFFRFTAEAPDPPRTHLPSIQLEFGLNINIFVAEVTNARASSVACNAHTIAADLDSLPCCAHALKAHNSIGPLRTSHGRWLQMAPLPHRPIHTLQSRGTFAWHSFRHLSSQAHWPSVQA